MSTLSGNSHNLPIPVFFIVDDSSFFYLGREFFRKEIELLDESDACHTSCTCYRDASDRIEYESHEQGKYRHPEHELEKSKAFMIS